MFTSKLSRSFPFVAIAVLVIVSLACSFSAGPNGFTFTSGDAPAAVTAAPAVLDAPQATEPATVATEAPAVEAKANTLTINVDGKEVELKADSNGAYFYATTIDGKSHSFRFTPPAGYSWALDADDAMGLVAQNALDDVLLFGDTPEKEYSVWGVFAGGLYVAPMGQKPDFAGPALRNRAQAGAQYQCPRPVYYMEPDNDTVVNVSGKVDPFTSICGN